MMQLHGSGGVLDEAREAADRKIWVTLTGLPLMIRLEWPFRRATSGADLWVLHGDIRLAGADGLHAPVAVNLSQTLREVMPSLEPQDAEGPVINALRKEVDRRQIEFLKSGKLLPVPFSSRHYDFKRQQWVFGKATDEDIAEFVERKVFWETRVGAAADAREIPFDSLRSLRAGSRPAAAPPPAEAGGLPESAGLRDDASSLKERENGGARVRVWIADPADAQYLQTTTEHLLEVAARTVGAEGLLRMEGEWVEATPGLMNQAERFERARQKALEELEQKHAFERG